MNRNVAYAAAPPPPVIPPERPRRAIPRRALIASSLAVATLLLSVGGADAAVKRWRGLGDGVSWANAANWDGGVLPAETDDVVLDHTYVSGAYTVQLPGGATTVSVHRLTMWPIGSPGIILVLPATNIANPGLKCGDGVAGTDDIIIGYGAVLINSSVASFGNGIEANSVANGTVRIDNGGRYVHNTLRASSGIAPLLSTAPGTELGEFEYDVPGTNSFSISASGRTYGSLTLSRTAGSASYSVLGSSDWKVRGNLRLNTGVSVNSSMTGALRLAGNFSSDGVQFAVPQGQTVIFEGSSPQVMSGGSGLTINGNGTIQPGATVVLQHLQFFVNGVLTVNGRLRIDIDQPPGGVGTYAYGAGSGALELNSPTTPLTLSSVNQRYWPATGGPTVVYVRGMGVSLEVPRTVGQLLAVEAPVLGAQLVTVSGTLERRAGASFSASPTYASGGTLQYATGATPGPEWITGSTVGPGVPRNVTVDAGSGTVVLPAAGRTVPGDLTVVSGTLAYDSDAGSLNVRGSVNVEGTVSTYGRPLSLDGTGVQNLSSPSALAGVPLRIAKTSGSVRLSGDVELQAGLIFDGGAGDVLDLDIRSLALDGPISGSHVGLLRGGALASLDVGPTGVSNAISFASGAATLRRLLVDGPFDVAALTLGTDLAVTDSLVLVSGRVATGSYAMTIPVGGHLNVTDGWVEGRLSRDVPTGAGTPLLFPVGDAVDYAPATLVFGTVSTAGTASITTTPGDHPNLAQGSGIDPNHSVNRVWHLSRVGLTFDVYSAILSFPSSNIDPGSNTSRFGIARNDVGAWSATTPGVRTALSTEGLGIAGFGDLSVGQLPVYTLTVNSGPNGSVTVNPSKSSYTSGEIVRLTAVPATGYHLVQWGGAASGTTNPLDVVMTANKTISATFAINTYTVDVAIVGNGSVSKNPNQATYNHGSSVTLTATPIPHWHFKGWTGTFTGTTNPLGLTVTAPVSLTATFEIDSFPVNVSVIGAGAVTKVPNRAFYSYGDTTTLTAIPNSGYHFVNWGGDASGSTNPLLVVVTATKAISATFAINTYALTTPVVGTGTVGRSPNLAVYDHGTAVTLTATAGLDYHFVGWSGDTTTTTNPLGIVMTAPKSITATFAIDTRTLTITVNGLGQVLREPDLTEYPVGSSVQLTAVPDPGQAFAGWGGDAAGFANPTTVFMSTNRSVSATFEPNTPKYWTGLGDGISWSDGLNWIRGTPPIAADEVILDNGTVNSTYTINLPAGATPVIVHRLSVRPAPARNITLRLPATNTANPGLAVGDSLAGTDDIIIGTGGIIVNASGASAGNGIQANTVGNGTIRIENGGRYVHATLRSPAGVAPMLLTTTGTELGVFEYDVPGTGSYNLSLSGRTYGSLTLTRTAGAATYGALGSSACRVRGVFRTNTGVTFSSTMTGALQLEGGIQSYGAALSLSASQPLVFQGAAVQTISGTSSVQFLGTATIAAGSTLALTTTPLTASGAVVVNGALRLVDGAAPGGTGSYIYDNTAGTLEFFTQSSPYSVGSGAYWPTSNAPALVRVLGSGISFSAARAYSRTLSVQAPMLNAGLLSVDGTLEMGAGGSVSGAPVYSAGSLLRYAAPTTIGPEWGPGITLGPGVPSNVEIASVSGVVQQPLSSRMVTGNLTLTSGTYQLNEFGGDLLLAGNLSGPGVLNTNGHALLLRGTGPQTLTSTTPLAIDYLRVEKASGQVTLQADVTLRGSTGNVLEFNGSSGDYLAFDDHVLTLQGPIGGSNSAGRLMGAGTSSMVLAGSGNMGTLMFLTGRQVLGGLTVNVGGTNPTVALGTWLTVSGSLSLQNGVLDNGTNLLTVLNAATVTRTNGYVRGTFARQVLAGTGVAVNFDVGNVGYAPVGLVFSHVTTGGTIVATTTPGDHPNLGATSLDAQHSVNRWWTVSTSDASFDSCAATFGFAPADVDPGSNTSDFDVRRYSGTWTRTTPGAHTASSTTASGITGFGDFAVAEPLVYTLNLSATPGGSATKNPDFSLYDAGTVVTISATNQPGYHFTGWSGDTSGTTNPLTLVMTVDRAITANFQLNGPKQWVGTTAGGDGVTWTSGLNWTDGAAPASIEEVILDNTYVTGTYTLSLPGGTTTIKRLTITPSVGRTITLTLPVTNTANPGLQVGDGVAGTDDIVLATGAVLKNSSGASAGSGIALSSGPNGTMRIANGGRYVHNSLLSANATTSALTTAAGTEAGEYEYDVPGTSNFAVSVSNRTYGGLTLTRSAGAATYTASGANPVTVRGPFKTNANVTLTSTMSGALNLSGDLTVNGAPLTLPSTQTVNFNSNGVQAVSGSAAITLSGPSTIGSGTTLAINAPTFQNDGTMTISGALQLNQGANPAGSGTYAYTALVGTLIFNNSSGAITIANGTPYWPSTSSPANVTLLGAGGVNMGAGVTRTVSGLLKVGAQLSRAGSITVTGTLQMTTGGSINSSAPVYSGSATLAYLASLPVGLEWGAGSGVGSGVPSHVVVSVGTVTLPNSDRHVVGNLTISSGGALVCNASQGNLILHGNVTVDGALTNNGRTIQFTGPTVQTIGGAVPQSMSFVAINKSAGSVQLAADLTVTGTGTGLSFNGSAGDVLAINGRTLTLAGTIGGSDAAGKFSGTANSVLVLNADGAIGTIAFATGGQSLKHLTLGGASPTLSMTSPVSINGTLTLGSGRISNGTNTITLVGFGAITRTTGFISGNLSKPIATGSGVSATFEVGSGTSYAPATVTFGNVSTAGNLTVSTTSGDHPQIVTSGLDGGRSVNRFWTVSNGGIGFNSYASTFNYPSGDVDATADPATFGIGRYSGTSWSLATVGTRTPTTTQATGVTGFGDFAIGTPATYTVTLTTVGNGSASATPNLAQYPHGTLVVLTATPNSGNNFINWTGDTTTTTNPLTIRVTRNRALTANFTYSLTTNVVGTGSVTRNPNQSVYAPGTVVALTAVPGNGWHFNGWTGDTTTTSNPISLAMTSNRSVTATFAINTYTVTLSTVGNGNATKNPNLATHNHGSSVTLTATPNAGNSFVNWTGDTTTTTNPLTFIVTRNRALTANFTYTLTTNVVGSGSVSRNPNQSAYVPGTIVALTAVPGTGWHFTGWSGDTTSTNNPISLSMTSNRNVTATFALNTYTVTLSTVGNGTATRNPDQATYNYGSTVTLTGTPNPSNSFVSWSGDTATATNPLTIVVTKNRTLTANFTYTLTTSVVGTGSVTRNPNQGAYAPGTVVALTAVPGTGWHFTGWSGDTTATTNPISLAMTSNRSVTATFALNTYTVALLTVGNGTAARSPDQATYDYGSTVTLTGTPDAGNSFVSWGGDTATTTNPLTIVVTKNRSVTANFTYSLTTSVTGSGSVAVSPNQTTFAPGSVVTLTATPSVGWNFTGWSGDTTATTNPLTLVITRNRSLTATFALNSYTLTVATSGSGTVVRNPNQPTYPHGTPVTVTATASPNWHFTGWTGDTTAATNPLSLVMTRNRSLTATFALDQFALNVSVTGSGSVVKNPNLTTYPYGTAVTLTANASTNWHFAGWSGDTTAATNPLSLVVTRDRNLTATFVLNDYTLTTSVNGSGSVTKNPNLASYPHGTPVSLTAIPAPNWHFIGWSGDTTAAANPLNLVMTRNRSLTATFGIDSFAVAVTIVGSGSVNRSPNLPSYPYGTVVTLTANPQTGWSFTSWSGDTATAANPITLTVRGPKAYTATFTINSYLLTVSLVGNGSVTRTPNLPSYPHGTPVTVSATADPHWHFGAWSGDTTATSASMNLTMTRDRSLTATFIVNQYTLGVTTAGSGSVSRSPDQASYPAFTTVVLTATPTSGNTFLGWGGDTTASANPLTLTMTRNRSLTATFSVKLVVSANGSGTVTPSPIGPTYVPGTVVSLTAAPTTGYHFFAWSGDTSATANPLLVGMTRDRAISANFGIDAYILTLGVSGNGTVTPSPNQASYDYGTPVTLTAVPAAGWHFAGWSGDTIAAANPLSLVMTRNRSLTAQFAIDSYTLTVTVTGKGSVAINPDQPSYPPGANVSLTAQTALGWTFMGWGGDLSGTTNPLNITMTHATTAIAAFADRTPPSVQVFQPNGNDSLTVGDTLTLKWSATDLDGVQSVDVWLVRPTFSDSLVALATSVPNSGAIAWTVPWPPVTQAYVRVVARDTTGNATRDQSDTPFVIHSGVLAAPFGDGLELALWSPTPNPAAGPLRLGFTLPVSMNVRLTVVDITGREVARLVEGQRPPGPHEVMWRGGGGRAPAPPGVYFARLDVGGVQRIRRFVLTP